MLIFGHGGGGDHTMYKQFLKLDFDLTNPKRLSQFFCLSLDIMEKM